MSKGAVRALTLLWATGGAEILALMAAKLAVPGAGGVFNIVKQLGETAWAFVVTELLVANSLLKWACQWLGRRSRRLIRTWYNGLRHRPRGT